MKVPCYSSSNAIIVCLKREKRGEGEGNDIRNIFTSARRKKVNSYRCDKDRQDSWKMPNKELMYN